VQVSAIGADAESPSEYARTRAEGEAAVRAAIPGAVIVRPSVVFGQDDDFFNRFASLAMRAPFLPLIGGGETRFQPVFVGDVGAAIARAATDPACAGRTYELGGPATYTFRELMELVVKETQRKRPLVTIPWGAAGLIGKVGDIQAAAKGAIGLIPRPQLTSDQVENLRADNVANPELPGLVELGVQPTALEPILPTYLYRYRRHGQFAEIIAAETGRGG
jgi:NADH dehydrogenase